MSANLPREDEIFSNKKFMEWLKENDPLVQIDNCFYEPNGSSTFPDFTVHINKQKFNLEVTTVLEGQNVGLRDFSTTAMSNMHNRFIEQLEERARQESMLCGTYEIVVERIVPDFQVHRDSLESQILQYLEQTKNDESTRWARIVHCGKTIYHIKKHAKSSDGLFPGGPDSGGGKMISGRV